MTLQPADFAFLAATVHRHSAIVVEPGKDYLFETRLAPVARTHGLDGVPALVGALRARPYGPLLDAVIDAMTTNETSFFRDQHPFDALTSHVLPDLMGKRPGRNLNVWAAACSSGQEPYSLAITLQDAFARHPGWSASILATDLSAPMLDRTREGRYTQMEVNRGLPATRLVQHFTRAGVRWEANPALRSMITTKVVNLAAPWPVLPAMDIVFLRNVLIYFDPPTKVAVLARLKKVLRPDGYLFLGAAETTIGLDPHWQRVPLGRASAYQLTPGKGAA